MYMNKDYYYLLESGELTQSKWEKAVGESHRDSKIKFVLTEEQFYAVHKAIAKEQAKKKRQTRRETDLWLAGLILKAGISAGIGAEHTLGTMKQFAPGSFNVLKSIVK